MLAGSPAIRLGAGLVAIATHGRTGAVASEAAGTLVVTGLVLNSSVAADQAVIAVAASVRRIRPVAIVPVVGLTGGVGTVPIVAIPCFRCCCCGSHYCCSGFHYCRCYCCSW